MIALSPGLHLLPLRWLAGRRRARGRYDRPTLRLFRRCSRPGDAHALVDYALFRRDLGYSLHSRFVPPLLAQHDRLRGKRRWQAAALLSEIGAAPEWMWDGIDPGPGITIAAPNQPVWRTGFRRAIRAAAAGAGIFVVGNARTMIGSGLGERIDAADLVVRFNQWRGDKSACRDIGTRTSVWVTSPGYSGPRYDAADWVALTGPDMSFRLRRWGTLEQRLRQARPVLTVPLAPWGELVASLSAPPSAGLLMLGWLRGLLGTWQGISAAGIGDVRPSASRYHHAGWRLRRSSRHDWHAESALVRRWVNDGLMLLPVKEAA